ncbi:MAG: hypothetical protein NWE93_04685 [Candidatus Bathyarchaeota archaeon]|nr:hypothetical protein [Candidatus Bathyarchaeota archaeon]
MSQDILLEKALEWLNANIGKEFESPRAGFSRRRRYSIRIICVDNERVKVEFVGSKWPALPLYFWMFQRVVEYLQANREHAVVIGAKLQPPYEVGSLEDEIWRNSTLSQYKTAPHICDILSLANIVSYTKAKNTKGRMVQAVRLSK